MAQPVDVLWTRVICKQSGRYIGWPTIARCKTGKLLAVFSGDRAEHMCPSGKLIGLFRVGGEDLSERFLYQADSDDGGRTWTPQMQHNAVRWLLRQV